MPSTGNPPINTEDPNNPSPNPKPQPTPAAQTQQPATAEDESEDELAAYKQSHGRI